MNHTFKHINPVLSAGVLASIGFMLVVSEDGYEETASWLGPCAMPAPAGGYTEADYLAKCDQIARALGLADPLEVRIAERRARDAAAAAAPPGMSEPTDEQKRTTWTASITAIIGGIIGDKMRFQLGYVEREAAARAYIAAGYQGDVDAWITDFADEAKMEYPAAADLIAAQADHLRTANKNLEKLRMQKYRMLEANTPAIEDAQAEYLRIIGEAYTIRETL